MTDAQYQVAQVVAETKTFGQRVVSFVLDNRAVISGAVNLIVGLVLGHKL